MSPEDLLVIGMPLFAGILLLIRSLDRVLRPGLLQSVGNRIVDTHVALNGILIAKGVLRFPGAHLVRSLRGWAAGWAVFLASTALLLSLSGTAAEAVFAPVPAVFLGAGTAYWSMKDEAGKQIADIRRSLPAASFLLSLLLEAGTGSQAALQEVAGALPRGALSRELGEISRSRTLGVPRAEALDRSRARVPLDEYRLFMNLIQQGEKLGVGLSQGLRELSAKIMESQEHRAEAMAQQASVKLLFPLVVFIFPAVFLVILSPVMLYLFGSTGG